YAESAKRAAEAAKTFATHQQQLAVQLSASSGALQALHNLQEQEKAAEDLLAAKSDADAAIRVAGLHDVTAAIKDQVEAQQAQIEIQQESARKAKEVYEKTAQSIESFIDRVFLTARSVSDVLHQFLMQSLGSLTKWVSQMLASWLTGIKQMSGAGPGGGGILGSLLAGVFGIGGGGGGSGALTSALAFGGGGSALSLPGGGTIQGVSGGLDAGAISAFGAAAPLISGSQVLTGGAIPKALGGATSGIFGNAAFGALTPQSIFTLALTKGMLGGTLLSQAYNTGNPLEGAAGGYLASGGILGAVVGAILGMFGRGRAKEKAAGLEQGFEFAADDLYKQFYQHQVDYDSALQGMQTLIDQGRQKLLGAGLGRWGEQGAQNLTRVIQDEVRALEELEKQREATTANIAGLTLPEFLSGGPVLSNGFQLPGGGIPAILHPDEWVLNSRQVEILGRGFLSNLPRFAAGGPVGAFAGMAPQGENRASGRSITVNVGPIYQQPGENGEVFASRVVRAFKRAVLDGAL
ncbi:MAG: hypothetical protein LAO07_18180, partial [Acidobacteriia bacterium]|nr:hypothetical protein [Terriglobia bacterium]